VSAGEPGDLSVALASMPVFPLPRVVLFPRALLPLHIFEPRYKKMLDDCLDSHRCLAMACVVEGTERDEVPRFERVAGAGVVVEREALPDGRSNILLHGRTRVVLDELPFEPPYRRARATLLVDVHTIVPAADRTALHAAAASFVAEVRRRNVDFDFALPVGVDDGAAADLCAHHLVFEARTRQRALEETDVVVRTRIVATAIVEQAARLVGERGGGGPN
jgi:Lon protease-like protein